MNSIFTNQTLGRIRASWENANRMAPLIKEDMRPIKIIHAKSDQLVLDRSYLVSPEYGKRNSTKFKLRIQGKGYRRIDVGYRVIQYKWHAQIGKFIRELGDECNRYYFVEIDKNPVIVIFLFDHPDDLNQIPYEQLIHPGLG